MDLQQLVKQILLWDGSFPEHALAQLVDNEEGAKAPLRALLQETLKNYQTLPEGYVGHVYAFYLLAYFRDAEGFLPALKVLTLPDAYPEKLLGHFLTQSFSQVIASCYGGNLEPLFAVIEEQNHLALHRIVALVSLSILYNIKKVDRATVVGFFTKLLERPDTNEFLLGLAEEVADLHLAELKNSVLSLYHEGKISSNDYTEQDFRAAIESGFSNPRKFFLIEDIFLEINGSEYSGTTHES